MEKNILQFDTVALDDQNSALVIIDQTKLPGQTVLLSLTEQKDIWDAIYELKVRGAPAIGVAAAMGIYLAAKGIDEQSFEAFYEAFKKAKDYLNASRPTAVNLSWALGQMEDVVLANREKTVCEIKKLLKNKAVEMKEEDTRVCLSIGEHALTLLKPGMGLLTHCNAGQLATTKYGTATAAMYLGQQKGYNFKVYCDETRPLLQGARLTAFELMAAGIDTTLLCDNMAASAMSKGYIQAVFVGCDRVAANGDTANKIGTLQVAIAAKYYGIPFYVCAPTSTIDMACANGANIHIEQRPGYEVTDMWYKERMAPADVKVYNPAFDVTDAGNITAIITERGIAYPPYSASLGQIMNGE